MSDDITKKKSKSKIMHDLLKENVLTTLRNTIVDIENEQYYHLKDNYFHDITESSGKTTGILKFKVEGQSFGFNYAVNTLIELKEDSLVAVTSRENNTLIFMEPSIHYHKRKEVEINFNDIVGCDSILADTSVMGAAMHQDGDWYIYSEKPMIAGDRWILGLSDSAYWQPILSEVTHPDWTKSWTENPNYKQK